MNNVSLIGRLTRDPEVKYISESQIAVTTFAIAVDRPVKAGNDKKTDFPRITVFGKQAENCEKYLKKGSKVGIQGRVQTGTYVNKNGNKVYTVDIVAERIDFLSWDNKNNDENEATMPEYDDIPEGFQHMTDDIPF